MEENMMNNENMTDQNGSETSTLSVAEFVDIYNKDVTKGKVNVAKAISIVPYITYEVKIALASTIVSRSGADESRPLINSPMRYIYYVYTIINFYTNIKFDDERIFEDFNLLNRNGLIEYIFSLIPQKEIEEFKTVLNMVQDDYVANNMTTSAFFYQLIDVVMKNLSDNIDPLIEAIKGISQTINSLDKDQLEALTNQLNIATETVQ